MSLHPALLRAYRATRYAVGTSPVRIGRRAPDLDTLLRLFGQCQAALITAWNPLSRRMPEAWNHRMQHRLRMCVRRWTVREAAGSLGRWREAHLCVLADPRPCLVLARRFRQRAIVVLRRGQPVRLVVLA